jgi:glutamyl-Q tRNA(Asp) synthetase
MPVPANSAQPVYRFAPSPNGYLHLGHALSALLNYDMAAAANGRFLLRIEDIDLTRCRPHYGQAIYEDLNWLGIKWEEPVRRQSDHLPDYVAAIAALEAQGLIYKTYETRAAFAARVAAYEKNSGARWPRDPDGAPLYPGPMPPRDIDADHNTPFALRLRMGQAMQRVGALSWREDGSGPGGESGDIAAQPLAWGDVVLARKETPTSYHLAVTLDDALQGVTHLVRGQDLFWSTSVHRVLQALLDLPTPVYTHHRLITDATGAKLSKSSKATALRELRSGGATPTDIRRLVGLDAYSAASLVAGGG